MISAIASLSRIFEKIRSLFEAGDNLAPVYWVAVTDQNRSQQPGALESQPRALVPRSHARLRVKRWV
jgi:hypothetical protein